MLERICCAVVLGKFVKKKRKKEGKNKFMKSWKVEMRFVSNIKFTSTFFSFFRTMDPPMSTVQLTESLTAPLLSDISPPHHNVRVRTVYLQYKGLCMHVNITFLFFLSD